MKKQIAIVTRAIAAVAVGAAVSIVLAQCYEPNLLTKQSCNTPSIGDGTFPVESCSGNTENQCNGILWGALYVYDVQQFPIGTVSSSTGATHQPLRPCVRHHGCTWNTNTAPPRCEDNPNWSPWAVQPKIEANPDVTCPEP